MNQENIFVARCYNESRIGVETLFGEQIAIREFAK
jgi:hypothetical protein